MDVKQVIQEQGMEKILDDLIEYTYEMAYAEGVEKAEAYLLLLHSDLKTARRNYKSRYKD